MFRDTFASNGGVLDLRDGDDHRIRIACLHGVAAMIIVWNASYMQPALEQMRNDGNPLDDTVLAHIMPTMTKHINRLGRFEIRPNGQEWRTDPKNLKVRSTKDILHDTAIRRRSRPKQG